MTTNELWLEPMIFSLPIQIQGFLPLSHLTTDGSVYNPSTPNPYGFLEIKCSYKYQDMLPTQAASKSDFWCSLLGNELKLKENHVYYSQVQGQMAVGGRQWCDFCTYTKKGKKINLTGKSDSLP